ncbi:nitroreductase [Candidatus Aerophobetes bacterium]|uniref:Nitroreductase n=1 Tax=Aerophobetes bacterium TaxID=2030807 RepID=A0A662DIY4_UNCAE|nr:MAG: nitroreductase [Candidatus Aerophobetes bacterium]
MDFYEVIRTRRSIREYQERPVEEDKLQRILEAARLAPSAANRQPWQFLVIKTEKIKKEFQRAYNKDWFWQAPVIICACGIKKEAWIRSDGKSYLDVDVAIAMDHLVLAATAEGLGTCWIGAFNPSEVKKILNLPDDIEPVALTPLGYPATSPKPTHRKPLGKIVKRI